MLRGALRGEIGEDQAAREQPVEIESADRQLDRNDGAARSGQVHFAACAFADGDIEQPGERGAVVFRDQVKHGGPDQLRGVLAGHRAKPRVRVEDDPTGGDGGGAFAHRLDDEPVRAVGGGVDLLMAGQADDQRVDGAGPDRLDRLLQFAQLGLHFGQLGAVLRGALTRRARGGRAWTSGSRHRRAGRVLTRLSQYLRRLFGQLRYRSARWLPSPWNSLTVEAPVR